MVNAVIPLKTTTMAGFRRPALSRTWATLFQPPPGLRRRLSILYLGGNLGFPLPVGLIIICFGLTAVLRQGCLN